MSESGDYVETHWDHAHDFKKARATYDRDAGRSYHRAQEKKVTNKDLLVPRLSTRSRHPLIVVTDVTGSMHLWPGRMFSKLPFLEFEAKEYLGDDAEISFCAVGDLNSDTSPLQTRPFTGDKDAMKRQLNDEIVKEAGGGSGLEESYEMAALYLLHCLEAPNADRPIVIFIGDEMPYSFVSPEQVEELIGITLPKRLTAKEVFAQLMERCEVFLIRKPYGEAPATGGGNALSPTDQRIYDAWAKLIGADRIYDLPNPDRVVDVMFGLLAQATDRIQYFREELKGRQTPEQVAEVFKTLRIIHGDTAEDGAAGEVVTHKKSGGKKAKPLI